jgi:hypothetical protein
VNIFDIQKFECVDITNFSYPQPWYIGDSPKVIEFLFLHTRYDKGRRFLCTVPIGKSGRYDESKIKWLAKIEKGHYQLSEPFHSPKTTLKPSKIGTCFNFHPDPVGLNARTNIYYMETRDNGETWVTGNGKDLKLPLIEKLNLALVVDYEEHGLLVYLKDMTFDSKGNPILLYLTSPTYQSGPTDPLRIWTTAYWNGDHWRVSPSPEISKKMNQTTDIDSIITSDSNYDMGSLYVENEDLWRIIAPTNTGPQPFNPGGEVTVWESTDKGLHWKTVSSITKNSHNNHTYIRRPLHAHPEFIGFWADGNPRKKSKSSLYYYNMNRAKVKKME